MLLSTWSSISRCLGPRRVPGPTGVVFFRRSVGFPGSDGLPPPERKGEIPESRGRRPSSTDVGGAVYGLRRAARARFCRHYERLGTLLGESVHAEPIPAEGTRGPGRNRLRGDVLRQPPRAPLSALPHNLALAPAGQGGVGAVASARRRLEEPRPGGAERTRVPRTRLWNLSPGAG